jgi:hypothetical protein
VIEIETVAFPVAADVVGVRRSVSPEVNVLDRTVDRFSIGEMDFESAVAVQGELKVIEVDQTVMEGAHANEVG